MSYHTPPRLLAAAAFLFVGCAEPSGPPLQIDRVTAEADARWPVAVTGEGTVLVTAPPPAVGTAEFAFNARQDADGHAQGEFHMKRQRAGFTVDFSGEVTCVTVDRATNRAWIGGRVTENRSDDPFHTLEIHEPGQDVWFRVVDNGEGAGAEPDRSTVYGFRGAGGVTTSAEYCALQLWPDGDANAWQLIEGNIQLHQP